VKIYKAFVFEIVSGKETTNAATYATDHIPTQPRGAKTLL
jgi:hypothetical protein